MRRAFSLLELLCVMILIALPVGWLVQRGVRWIHTVGVITDVQRLYAIYDTAKSIGMTTKLPTQLIIEQTAEGIQYQLKSLYPIEKQLTLAYRKGVWKHFTSFSWKGKTCAQITLNFDQWGALNTGPLIFFSKQGPQVLHRDMYEPSEAVYPQELFSFT